MKSNQQGNANSNDAAERNKSEPSFLQRTVGITIIAVAFIGLLVIGLTWFFSVDWVQGVQTTYVYEEARGKFLGIFGSGADKIKALTVEGFIIPPYVKYSVISVVNFLFGASVVKLRRV